MIEEFVPASNGCSEICIVWQKEKDICCSTGRQCCYFCFEFCPIKEEYKIDEIVERMHISRSYSV